MIGTTPKQPTFIAFSGKIAPLLCGLLLPTLLAITGVASAFTELNDAQNLIYDTPHLANTSQGQTISYRYQSRLGDDEPVIDTVSLAVNKAYDDDRRDVSVEFLTAERRQPFPDFNGFRGNPVIIAMLEHIAQDLGERVGGGTLYFRNRIRDGLAKEVDISTGKVTSNNKEVASTIVSFRPFVDDKYIGPQPEHANAEFTITLSDEIPGGVISIAIESASDKEFFYRQEISVE